jgi:hypothetical protein
MEGLSSTSGDHVALNLASANALEVSTTTVAKVT